MAGGGGSPGLHDQREEGWRHRRSRPKLKAKGLALTLRGPQAPNERGNVSPARLFEETNVELIPKQKQSVQAQEADPRPYTGATPGVTGD